MPLKRDLGLFDVVMLGVGIIFGAGIYVLIGQAAAYAGSALWLSFVVAAIIASFTGLSFAELASMFPKDGSVYLYVKNAYGIKPLSFLIGWMLMLAGAFGAATVSIGFGGYLESLTGIPRVLSAAMLVIIFSILNWIGIKFSSIVNIIFTLIESAGLLLIIIIALPFLGSVNYIEMPHGFAGIFTSTLIIFFAYLGFENIVNIAEEIKNPRKIIPLALIISIIITTIVYILVSISIVSIMPWQKLAESSAPVADAAASVFPQSGFVLFIIALFSTANTVLIMLISISRVLWGMAGQHVFPQILRKVDYNYKTPSYSIAAIGILVLLFISIEKITILAQVTDILSFIIFFMVNTSVILLRFRMPNYPRAFKVPFSVMNIPLMPLFGALFSIGMLFYHDLPFHIIIALFVIVLIGLLMYFLGGKYGRM